MPDLSNVPSMDPIGLKKTQESLKKEDNEAEANTQKIAYEQGGGDAKKVNVHPFTNPEDLIDNPALSGLSIPFPPQDEPTIREGFDYVTSRISSTRISLWWVLGGLILLIILICCS